MSRGGIMTIIDLGRSADRTGFGMMVRHGPVTYGREMDADELRGLMELSSNVADGGHHRGGKSERRGPWTLHDDITEDGWILRFDDDHSHLVVRMRTAEVTALANKTARLLDWGR